jgi:hypothetical protein
MDKQIKAEIIRRLENSKKAQERIKITNSRPHLFGISTPI